jgi:hypothetical protein
VIQLIHRIDQFWTKAIYLTFESAAIARFVLQGTSLRYRKLDQKEKRQDKEGLP